MSAECSTRLRALLAALRHRWRRWLVRSVVGGVALIVLAAFVLALAWHLSPFPRAMLSQLPLSPIVTDRHGALLALRTTPAGDFRIPVTLDRVSPWLSLATLAVEDERFRSHVGVDPVAVLRAAWQNLSAGRIVSGASTLTMQLCNLLEPRPRGVGSKMLQSFRALQLERLLTKDEILAAYLNLAPYGGNLRGVESAARRYFGRPAAELTLGEAALLAGLPQAPSRYRPDRHPSRAIARRATVLRRMRELGYITIAQEHSAAAEPVPPPYHCPASPAAHAAQLALLRRPSGGRTTIDASIQQLVTTLAAAHGARAASAADTDPAAATRDATFVGATLPAAAFAGAPGGVPARATASRLPPDTDLAVVIIEVATGEIVALLGSADFSDPRDGQVNGALARRSPGSALKPFIYAAAFETGRLAPDSIVHDIPIRRAGWSPRNFDRRFAGPLSAAEALRRSLNVPAILVAEGVGAGRCLGLIESLGLKLPPTAATRSGLALVVGGLETTLLDLTNAYATLARGGLHRPARLFADEPSAAPQTRVLNANICAALDDILSTRHRTPSGLTPAQVPRVARNPSPWFMWKTGTSAGRRDAWAVGHNHRYAIGVWVGRFSGLGHPSFVGGEAAEPLLSALFAHPALRSDLTPPPAAPWLVRNPLPPPLELGDTLRILVPQDGAILFAVDGAAIIRPRVSGSATVAELSWFLNGRSLDSTLVERLTLPPAGYELRCVSASGAATAVRFRVRVADSRGDARQYPAAAAAADAR